MISGFSRHLSNAPLPAFRRTPLHLAIVMLLLAFGIGISSVSACACDEVTATKTVSGVFEENGVVIYTVVLTNDNPWAQGDNAGNEFVDVLPADLSLVSANSTSGTTSTAGNTVNWNGSIPMSGSVTITITATINAGTDGHIISNQGIFSYDSDNNSSNDGTTITDDPDVIGASNPTSFVVGDEVVISNVEPPPAPPASPLCEDQNFDESGVVHASTSDALGYAINCRVLYQNDAPTQWLGGDQYSSASIGIPGIVELGIQQAVDIFSPSGQTYFQGGAVFCLRGTGYLIWLAASGQPRHAEIIDSYTVPEFEGFTCVTLFEPGTLILVTNNPIQ